MAGQKEISVGVKFTGDDAGFQRVVRDMNTGIGQLNSQFGNLAKSVGAVAVIDLATKGFEAYSKVMNSTEGSAETLERQISTLNGAMSGLMRTIATGSWDSLISNITKTASATREAKEATQEFEHASAGRTITRGSLMIGLQESRVSANEATNPTEKAKYLSEAVSFQKQITALNVSEISERLGIDEEYYKKLTGHSKEYFDYFLKMVPSLAENYEHYFGKDSIVLEGIKSRLSALSNDAFPTKATKEEINQLRLLQFVIEDYKTVQDDLSKKGQWDNYIRGIGEMKEEAAAGEKALVRLVKQLTASQQAMEPVAREGGFSADTKSPYGISNAGFAKALNKTVAGLNMPGFQIWDHAAMDETIKNMKLGLIEEEKMTKEMQLQEEVAGDLESVFGDMFASIGKGWQSMADAAVQAIERIAEEIMTKFVVTTIMNALFPGSGNAFSLIGNMGSNMAMGHYASGTNFAPGGLSLVGERGPEIVNLPRGAQVIPNSGRQGSIGLKGLITARDIQITGEIRNTLINTST
jgi:hypothetical protein